MSDVPSRVPRQRRWLVAALPATLGVLAVLSAAGSFNTSPTQPTSTPAPASTSPSSQPDGLPSLNGEWIFVDDRTEGRALEQLGPPMSSKFSMRVEEGAIILNGHGSGHKDVRVALDGSKTEIVEPKSTARYTGSWKDNTFEYKVEFERASDQASASTIRMITRSFRPTPEGLLVTVIVDPPIVKESVALYRHAEDIPMPAPAKAVIGDLSWLAGAWVGTRSSGSSIEERWSPPLGGAMLAVSRSVNTSGKMVAFEYLRIVERDGGLVYIAQPGGGKPTEFVLTQISTEKDTRRLVFDNPRHDSPQRIVYELSAQGGLSASIGQLKGGTPRKFEFRPEGKPEGK